MQQGYQLTFGRKFQTSHQDVHEEHLAASPREIVQLTRFAFILMKRALYKVQIYMICGEGRV
jgi:hypothetical protein